MSGDGLTTGAATSVASIENDGSGGLAKGSLHLFLAQICSNFGYLIAVVIIARALGPEGRGLLGFITMTALLIARTGKLGLSETTTVFAAQRPSERAALLANLLTFSSTAALLLGGAIGMLLLALPDARPAQLTNPLIVLLVVGCVATSVCDTSFLIGCGDTRHLAIRIATGGWMYAAAMAVAAAGPGLDITTATVAWVASQTTLAGLLHAAPARRYGIRPPDLALLLQSVRFGYRAWAGTLSLHLNSRADQVLMGFMATEAALGYYAIAVNAAEMLLYLPAAVATALLPTVARRGSCGGSGWTLRVFRCAMTVSIATSVVAGCVGPLVLPLVFGSEFQPSVLPFLLLLPGVAGYAAMSLFSNALLGLSHPGRSSLGPLTAAVIGLALAAALIPRYAAEGASVAASLAMLAGGLVSLLLFRRHEPFRLSEIIPTRQDLRAVLQLPARLLRR